MSKSYPTITVKNSLSVPVHVYDAFQNSEDDKSLANYFGTLTGICTIDAGGHKSFTPIHGPVSTYIVYDEAYTPVARYFSLGMKSDTFIVTEAAVETMKKTESFVKLMQTAPDNADVKAFNTIVAQGKGTAKKVDDFFAGTGEYKEVTYISYMLAVVALARTPATRNKPPQEQAYRLSTLLDFMGFHWPPSIPDVEIAHFHCAENDKAITIGGDLELTDLTFADGVLSRLQTFIPNPAIHFLVQFVYNGGLATGMTCLKFGLDKVCIPIGDHKTFDIDKPTILLSLNPLFSFVVFEIKAEIPFNIFNSPTIDADIAMTIDNVEAEVGVVLKGNTTSLLTPPAVKGLHFDSFGVGLGLVFEPEGFAIGLEGTFHIGDKGAVALTDDRFALICEMEEEIPNPLYFAFYVPKLDLSEIITIFTNTTVDVGLPVTFSQLSFRWAENIMEPITLPDGSLAPAGYGFSGAMDLFGLQFYGDVRIDLNSGIHGTVTMDPLHWGPLLQLTGDGKGVSIKVDKKGTPIPLNAIPKTAAERKILNEAVDKQVVTSGGPEMSVSTSSSPYFTLDAKVSLFDLVEEKIDAVISNDGISFELDYGAILTSKLHCVLQDYHNFRGDFSYGISLKVPLPAIAGIGLGTVNLIDVGCNAGIVVTTSLSDIMLKVRGGFEFEGLSLSFGPFTADIHIDKITVLIEKMGEHILADAGNIFTALMHDAMKWAKLAAKGLITDVEDIGKGLKVAFGKTAKEAASIMKDAGCLIKDIGNALTDIFGLSSSDAYSVLLEAGYSQKQLKEGGITMPDNASNIMWSQFTQEISAKLGAGTSEAAIQVLPQSQLLFGKNVTEMGKTIDTFSGTVPQWGAIYNPSDAQLTDSYQIILTQVKETATSGTKIEAEYENEHRKLIGMMQKASDYKLKKMKSYLDVVKTYTACGLTPPRFDVWFKNNGLEAYDSILQDQKNQTRKVQTLLEAQGVASPLIEALARLNTELSNIKDTVAPAVTATPGADMLFSWKDKPTNPGSLFFTDCSTHYDYSKTVWHSQSGVKLFGFFSLGHHSETHTHECLVQTSSSYSLKMDFAAQAAVDIVQGRWFDGAMLRNYKEGPWVKGSQFQIQKSHPYGQGGILPVTPTRLYVVMNPTITITLDQSTYTSVKDSMQSSGGSGISLGPFAFGGNSGQSSSTHTTIDTDDQTHTITCTDTSNIPQIIAIADQIMP